jgi:hypothetical protein
MGSDTRARVAALFEDARTRGGIPERVASEAAEATLRWLRGTATVRVTAGRRRVEAYFWAVVRRRALAGAPGLASYRSRCVADTLAADMLAAGHAPARVLDELTRVVGASCAVESLAEVAA